MLDSSRTKWLLRSTPLGEGSIPISLDGWLVLLLGALEQRALMSHIPLHMKALQKVQSPPQMGPQFGGRARWDSAAGAYGEVPCLVPRGTTMWVMESTQGWEK